LLPRTVPSGVMRPVVRHAHAGERVVARASAIRTLGRGDTAASLARPLGGHGHRLGLGHGAQKPNLPKIMNAMTNVKITSDSMKARPRSIGVNTLSALFGLRQMPSSAAAAALP
jgi:hypothetical protein